MIRLVFSGAPAKPVGIAEFADSANEYYVLVLILSRPMLAEPRTSLLPRSNVVGL
jgi:hypothetical protein